MNINPHPTTSKIDCEFEDDEIFDDSSFLAKLDNTSFKGSKPSESNINSSFNKSGLNISALCCDEEISGYDKITGKTWIYPTNYPVRDYQFNIIKAAILKNTLVSLPTGLGKTFIAAVVMYNFYRWYPLGKIVFTAPTRPLVAQQIDACYNIIAIPPNDTIEMTGHMHVNTRKMHWQSKRVFFATPQVIYNDIKSGICPGEKIRCLVIDEAHRARGNYAYCQIVSSLSDMGHRTYRILALSATPGSKVEDVISVVKSLQIAHLELRTENCIDVAPYSHSRKITTVIVPLGPELTQLRQQYVEILDGYARRLKQFNILPQNLGNLSKGRIVMLYKEFQNKDKSARHPQHNYIMKDFTLLIALYHGLELLVKHGSRVFLNFFDEHPEKSWIQSDDRLTALLERLRDDLGVDPMSLDRSILPDGTMPEIPKNLSFGHPKFYKLKEIMVEHFSIAKKKGQDTKAIVFCEYRESVNLVHCLLLQCRPLIMPQMFVGQGASGKDGKAAVSQKQQLRVMRSFRAGGCNALAATCVAEEGLDVGAVDLILCFDISSRSPVRLVQRCGRTGRERGGQVYILVTEGREHQTLLDCMRQRDGLNKKILQSKEVDNNLYKHNPRMMPHDFTPQCQKMYINVAKKTDPKEKVKDNDKPKKNQKDLRTMLLGKTISSSSSSSKEFENSELITEEEFKDIFPEGFNLKTTTNEPVEFWNMTKEKVINASKVGINNPTKLSSWLEWQRVLQKTVNIGHSKDSEILAELLQYSDAKRFDMPPSTQNPTFNTQDLATQNVLPSPVKAKPKSKKTKTAVVKSPLKLTKSPGKKDGDIRALFSTATKSTKSYTKLISDLGIKNDGSIPTKLITLLVDLNLENTNSSKPCYVCQNVCDCSLFNNIRKNKKKPTFSLNFLVDPKLPEIDLIDDIGADVIAKYAQSQEISQDLKEDKALSYSLTYTEDVEWANLESPVKKKNISHQEIKGNPDDMKNCSSNFDLEFDFGSSDLVSSPPKEKTPERTYLDSKDNLKSNNNFELELDLNSLDDFEDLPNASVEKVAESNEGFDNKFEIGDIEDIFAESSPDENTNIKVEIKDEKQNDNEALGFFGLNSIDDIFADDDSIDTKPTEEKALTEADSERAIKNNEKPVPATISPSILSGRPRNFVPTSPILCSQNRKFQLSTKKPKSSSTPVSNVRRRLINDPVNISSVDNSKQNSTITNSLQESKNKSMFTITQLVDMINKPSDNSKLNHTETLVRGDVNIEEDRSTSPILLTQADKKRVNNTEIFKNNTSSTSQLIKSASLIILDSDSDSSNDNTQVYDIKEEVIKGLSQNKEEVTKTSPVTFKRKFNFDDDDDDDFMTNSPYFNKKPKLENSNSKPLTLQEKVLAALSSNKTGDFKPSNFDSEVNFSISPKKIFSQKENKDPQYLNGDTQCDSDAEKEYVRKHNLEMLQVFRRDSKVTSPKNKFKLTTSNPEHTKAEKSQKRKLNFDESDDDFVDDKKPCKSQKSENCIQIKSTVNHKVRKKKKNSFLDLEAELSDAASDSGDELTDDSAGSIADFICDDYGPHPDPDMHAHYIQSVKSPVKGVFKIPELPKRYDKMEVLSQFVEEDTYEMDSFCVDSHIGLTQVNEISELELAEIALEENRRRKKKIKSQNIPIENNGESPIVRKKNKNARQINSDSEDSS